ncbi:hypothetical protein R5S80_004610 [Salmonella enterica]|uniref:hypothetical protein n=1 Tax=Enterobacteriaceae TaxID=543 RepID=UPI000D56F7F5|nr:MULTISPECIES: hypothetical protein [Enterobacteriaceae]EAU9173752.1 hypothetical protein [Salmonella enterica]EBF9684311.1 hypothetical protein [Salmonella enterica subsp. enterica serovar Typhimurium]EDW2276126.1 hypothetical protein [Salmonella enterica subsp. enterica serovar Enteritidis]EDZ8967329.1 hypothetical protein [Salmonella enterica subsp. enterica serovar Muenchen]EKW8472527.1 hypothetical protein [Klebsiella pneumoniae]HBJ6373959.1 hypothetical protein [Salmonella enterica su
MAISELSLGKQILEKINNHDRFNSRLRLKINLFNVIAFVILFAIGNKFNELIICLIVFALLFVLNGAYWKYKAVIPSSLIFDYFERSADDERFRSLFMGLFNSKKLLTVRDDRKKIDAYLYEQDKKLEEFKKIETITNGMKGRSE